MDNIKTRILTFDKYKFIDKKIRNHFKLNDYMVCFFNGKNWNVISLNVMLSYPIMYFDFWLSKDDTIYKNTLLVCPITLRSIIYKGIIEIIDIIDGRLFLLNKDTNDKFFLDEPYTGQYDANGNEKKIKSQIKRYDVKILLLRDVFMYMTDPRYIIVYKKYILSTIFDKSYYVNNMSFNDKQLTTKYHPKTLVYMIQYYSHKFNKYKYIVIHGHNIGKTITGYNYKVSNIFSYLNKNINTLINKKAYIYPILYGYVDIYYKDYTNIYL